MATVKRIVRDGVTLIVTKKVDGETRVSCECCQEDLPDTCCMYPIDKLGILFDEEDWPEEGAFYHNETESGSVAGPIILEKNLATVGNERVIYGNFGNNGLGGTAVYYLPSDLVEYFFRQGQIDPGGGGCLFRDKFDEQQQPVADPNGGSIWFFDNFADSYTAECTTTINGQTTTTTRTYVREALCIWRSRNQDGDITGQLYYRTNATPAEAEEIGRGRVLWRLDGAGYRSDEGPYTSPEGTYGENPECVVTADS